MIKLYNGAGEYLIQFSSTKREITLTEDELKELGVEFGQMEDKISSLRFMMKQLQIEKEELMKVNHKLQRGIL